MAFWDDIAEGNIGTALVIGLGAAVLLPAARTVLRPMAKTVIKGGLVAYDGVMRMTEDARAEMGTMVREAREEQQARSAQSTARHAAPGSAKSGDTKPATA